jgi:hypothetical protein
MPHMYSLSLLRDENFFFFKYGASGIKKICVFISLETAPSYLPWAVGFNVFDFFLKMMNTDPLMGAKLKSKTHLLKSFFYFLSCFLRVWLQSFQKVLM